MTNWPGQLLFALMERLMKEVLIMLAGITQRSSPQKQQVVQHSISCVTSHTDLVQKAHNTTKDSCY